MHQKTTIKLAVLLGIIFLFNTSLKANQGHVNDPSTTEENEKSDFDPVAFAFDHVLDAHEVHIAGEGASSITLPLPIILWTEKGLVTFLSSSFHHDNEGQHIVEKKGLSFVRYHEKIYQLSDGESHIRFEGKEIVNALNTLDLPIIMGSVLVIATLFIIINIMVDVMYSWLDPRIRLK